MDILRQIAYRQGQTTMMKWWNVRDACQKAMLSSGLIFIRLMGKSILERRPFFIIVAWCLLSPESGMI